MDLPQIVEESGESKAPAPDPCPRCGRRWDALPGVEVDSLGPATIRRCPNCGARATADGTERRWLFTCGDCGLPFLHAQPLPLSEHRCIDCRVGEPPADLSEPELRQATEAEIQAALAERWNFVGESSLSSYLDRLARQVAARIDGAPRSCRVVVVEDEALFTLALPSGRLLISLGTLSFLEDEAQLVFALGHELAHAASGDAARRLARLGLQSMASEKEDRGRQAWFSAALDLIRLGYGARCEHEADARALEAMLALRYDPSSVLHYLRRLHLRMELGDPQFADLATSHPRPSERARRIERTLFDRTEDDSVLRVNREVFRRAAGDKVLRARLSRCDFEPPAEVERAGFGRGWLSKAVWTSLGILILGLLILFFGLQLSF